MIFVGVDPGVRYCGVGRFEDRHLADAFLHPSSEALPFVPGLAGIVEIPQVYSRERSIAPPKDLIDLTFAAGRVTGNIPEADLEIVTPAQWKGQVPCTCTAKSFDPANCTHHRRMMAALTEEERFVLSCAVSRIRAKGLVHNVYDGVSLGLVGLRRL